ncbi:MAG: protoheme IX farnesyltransferase [Candidatus Tectomicrobia bacterium]|nr:protoheme IX farnesyltransferase [Candidatus Tectomicrobia bacterium]
MMIQSQTFSLERETMRQRVADYLTLTKPRVVPMVLLATAIGYYLGVGAEASWWPLLHTLIATALAAGGTMALNQYLERDLDALMQRTCRRPLPDGRLQPRAALIFGTLLISAGLLHQAAAVSLLSASATATTVAGYLFAYTPLKSRTPWCSIPGALAGALPPATGWIAARGTINVETAVLVALLFVWQLPHSLAIAWLYREDYARAGFRLLPVVQPDGRSTALQVALNSVALLAAGLLPSLVGMTGSTSFFVALGLGAAFLACCLHLALRLSNAAAQRVVLASLLYLPVQFAIMAWDKVPW